MRFVGKIEIPFLIDDVLGVAAGGANARHNRDAKSEEVWVLDILRAEQILLQS